MNMAPAGFGSNLELGAALPAPCTASGSLPSATLLSPCSSIGYVPGSDPPWQLGHGFGRNDRFVARHLAD
jgi:hypothetical protein